jgi:hypothetical protein
VVRAGVLADDEDGVGESEVFERDRALADADGLGQRAAARLVAHVRAVGQVVRAELPDEELIEERGLVARAARGVEGGLVGRRERVQLFGDQPKSLVPINRLVVVARVAQDHRGA